jgi:hydantoinase/carbamoylase family amidase
MPPTTSIPRAERAMERLDLLARIGAVGDGGGITRPGLSAAEDDAHVLVAGWCEEAGMTVSRDAAGNLYARPRGAAAGAEIWSGSHLDTVPSGGRFDGALGVVAALEAVADVAADRPEAPLAVVAFRDEEGWRFGEGCFGSRCVADQVGPDGLAERDSAGVSVAEALAALGLDGPPVGAALPAAYLEVHSEQGPILDTADMPLGDVAAIVGMAGFTVTFRGASGNAGTVPMGERSDAFAACAELALRLRERAVEIPGAVATIGDVTVAGAAANVIPGLVRATVDVRAPTVDALDALVAAVPAVGAGAPSPSRSRTASAVRSGPRPAARRSRSPRSPRVPATTPVCWLPPGSTRGCSSCEAETAVPATDPTSSPTRPTSPRRSRSTPRR